MPSFGVAFNYVSCFGFLYLVAAYIRFYPCKQKNWGLYTGIFILTGIFSIIGCLILGNRLDKQIAYRQYDVTSANVNSDLPCKL